MIFRFILLLLCCSLHPLFALPQEPQLSENLQFEERKFDFGEIQEQDGIVSHVFLFKNIGKTVVHISGMSTGCGCVQYEFPKEPIQPGRTGEVTVSYNPAYRPGFFSKEIVVLSNNNTCYNRIWIKGSVIPCRHPVSENYPYEYGSGLWMNFEIMAFGTISKGHSKTMELKYTNDTDKDMQLTFVVVGGNTDIKFTSPRLVRPHEEGIMPVTYLNSGQFGTETNIYPVVNGKVQAKPLTITCIKG